MGPGLWDFACPQAFVSHLVFNSIKMWAVRKPKKGIPKCHAIFR